ncbi:MAG: hypothetical protein AB7O90_19185 [Hyphomicrobium sp.]
MSQAEFIQLLRSLTATWDNDMVDNFDNIDGNREVAPTRVPDGKNTEGHKLPAASA